jgi:hypothetical protein
MAEEEPTAAAAKEILLEFFVHAWLTPAGARGWRRLLASRFADEMTEAQARPGRGEPASDVYDEVRRLAAWVGAIDAAMAWRGEGLAYRWGSP